MARYSQFLGRRVEVHYRAGDILLPASGMFVADSGRSVFLEQHLTQHGQEKNFRWEIPYQYIVRLEEAKESQDADDKDNTPIPRGASRMKSGVPGHGSAAAGAGASADAVTPIPPLSRPPKPA